MNAYKKRPCQFIIALEGFPFVAPVLVIAFVVKIWAGWMAAAPVFLVASFVALFFRNPPRNYPRGAKILLSPADGRVISVSEFEGFKLISIFMSVLNVHINRMPCDGRITDVTYKKGKFNIAHRGEAGSENERNIIEFEDKSGRKYRMVQIAGFVARRIVCYLKGGEELTQGERIGLIRFGSRVDLFLPREVEICVRAGENVKGGETIIGRTS